MNEIRPLTADEIEVRVGSIGDGYMEMLLYKNARVDMAMLDEIYGAANWQRDHKEVKGVVYCGIGVWDDYKKDWVWKWDAGAESYTEKEKGEASDSFKRAGTNWGIGRELYTSPRIRIEIGTQRKKDGYGYEIIQEQKWLQYGIYVRGINTVEENGKYVIKGLVLHQKNKAGDRKIFSWEAK